MKEIYVGNLPYEVSEEDIRGHFGGYGEIVNLKLITDRATGLSKGFGFIEFASQSEAEAAINATNGQEFKGRNLKVNLSRQKERTGGGGGGGGGGRW